MSSEQRSGGWVIQGAFRIEAADEHDATRVLDRLERQSGKPLGPGVDRRPSITLHVHVSEAEERSS